MRSQVTHNLLYTIPSFIKIDHTIQKRRTHGHGIFLIFIIFSLSLFSTGFPTFTYAKTRHCSHLLLLKYFCIVFSNFEFETRTIFLRFQSTGKIRFFSHFETRKVIVLICNKKPYWRLLDTYIMDPNLESVNLKRDNREFPILGNMVFLHHDKSILIMISSILYIVLFCLILRASPRTLHCIATLH